MKKTLAIIKEAFPTIIMIGLIPFVLNDYVLTLLYVVIIIVAFSVKREKSDFPIFIFGFIAMIISEYIFISTGVETFIRHSLFGVMPLWLPFLWAYSFVAIKRSVIILDK
jgi:hypothetical protein